MLVCLFFSSFLHFLRKIWHKKNIIYAFSDFSKTFTYIKKIIQIYSKIGKIQQKVVFQNYKQWEFKNIINK